MTEKQHYKLCKLYGNKHFFVSITLSNSTVTHSNDELLISIKNIYIFINTK